MKALWSVEKAAELLSISPWTLRAYIRDAKLRPVRIGRRVLLEESELERFIAFSKAQPVANEGSEQPIAPVQVEGLNA
jgi:excisionase family DNA binding protein